MGVPRSSHGGRGIRSDGGGGGGGGGALGQRLAQRRHAMTSESVNA